MNDSEHLTHLYRLCSIEQEDKLKEYLLQKFDGILDGNADIVLPDHNDCSLMHIAAENNRVKIMLFLFEQGMWLDFKDRNNSTPLFYACAANALEAVQFLVSRGADVNSKNFDMNTPLSIAIKNRAFKCAEVLLNANADLMAYANVQQQSILTIACENNDLDAVKYILSKGPNVMHIDVQGETCLFAALPFPDIVELLCVYARLHFQLLNLVTVRSKNGQLVSHCFSKVGVLKSAEIILHYVRITSSTTLNFLLNALELRPPNNTPLQCAIANMDLVQLFFKYHKFLQLHLQNNKGDTVLHEAIRRRNKELLSIILKQRNDLDFLNIENKSNQNADMIALDLNFWNQYQEIVSFERNHKLNVLPTDLLRDIVLQNKYTIAIIISQSMCNEEILTSYNSITDETYAADGTIVVIAPIEQKLLNQHKFHWDLRYEVVSDKNNTIAKSLGIESKRRFSLGSSERKVESVAVQNNKGQILFKSSHGTNSSLDVARVMSYYYRCRASRREIRKIEMKQKDDIFDWILQNDGVCKVFANQIGAGNEIINEARSDKRRRTVITDNLNEGVIQIYQDYIDKHWANTPTKKDGLLSPSSPIDKIIKRKSDGDIFAYEAKKRELRKKALQCFIRAAHFAEDIDEIMSKLSLQSNHRIE